MKNLEIGKLVRILINSGNDIAANLLVGNEQPQPTNHIEVNKEETSSSIWQDEIMEMDSSKETTVNEINKETSGVEMPLTKREDVLEKTTPSKIASEDPGVEKSSMVDFKDIKMIGQGSYGKVFKVTHKNSQFYAIKISKNLECHRELSCLQATDHPNIIKFIDSWSEPVSDEIKKLDVDNLNLFNGFQILNCIQTEWCSGGNLEDWITSDYDKKSERDAKIISYQISEGLKHLHSHTKTFLHRDLKPENIFLFYPYQKDGFYIKVKIGDLGFCRSTLQSSKGSKAHKMTENKGTKYYMAPEVKRGDDDYTTAIDIFAFGIIIYQLIMSTSPFPLDFENDKLTSRWFIQEFLSEYELLNKMLLQDPNQRPNASQIRDDLFTMWNIANEKYEI